MVWQGGIPPHVSSPGAAADTTKAGGRRLVRHTHTQTDPHLQLHPEQKTEERRSLARPTHTHTHTHAHAHTHTHTHTHTHSLAPDATMTLIPCWPITDRVAASSTRDHCPAGTPSDMTTTAGRSAHSTTQSRPATVSDMVPLYTHTTLPHTYKLCSNLCGSCGWAKEVSRCELHGTCMDCMRRKRPVCVCVARARACVCACVSGSPSLTVQYSHSHQLSALRHPHPPAYHSGSHVSTVSVTVL